MKNVVVTGAYGGMGKSVVKNLIESGYTVFALDKKIDNEFDGVSSVISIETDVTNSASVLNAFNVVKERACEVYAVIHLAGIYNLNSLIELSEDDFDKIFSVNLKGAFLVNKTFIPLLNKGSKIVIISSELAPLNPLPFTGIYAISKTALDSYARSLNMELGLLGINVSVIRPGAVKTDMLNVSTTALDKFCNQTTHYKCNADRFKKIVDSVESRNISTDTLAKKVVKVVNAKKPKLIYNLNRNPLLLLLNALPKQLQAKIIKSILK